MKTKSVVLGQAMVLCPCCGYMLRIGATVRLKATREIGQMPLMNDDEEALVRSAVIKQEEADRDG